MRFAQTPYQTIYTVLARFFTITHSVDYEILTESPYIIENRLRGVAIKHRGDKTPKTTGFRWQKNTKGYWQKKGC